MDLNRFNRAFVYACDMALRAKRGVLCFVSLYLARAVAAPPRRDRYARPFGGEGDEGA